MPQMQSQGPAGDEGADFGVGNVPQRLLEGTDGVIRMCFADRTIAVARGVSVADVQHNKKARVHWRRWDIERLHLRHGPALMYIQGAPLQQLIGPRYIVLRGHLTPYYDPCPAAEDLVLAEILSSPKGMTHKELFFLLRPSAMSSHASS